MDGLKQIPLPQLLCSFACSQIFTVVFSLYFFDVIGKTTADCYYVPGSKNPMTKVTATKFSTSSKATGDKKLVNVTENFDFMMMLGFYANIAMIAVPVAGLVLGKIHAMLGSAVAGLGGCASFVMGIMLWVCVFMYRGSEAGSVCAGSYIEKDLNAYQKAIVMSSKGSFLFFLLVVQWIGVGCCALSCLCLCGKLVAAKMSG